MPKVLPFKAVRPTRDKVGLLACRSYQSYLPEERDVRMKSNPYSFLHIVNPGYKYQKEVIGNERFDLVRNRYLEFKEDNVFIQEDEPSYYIYKIVDRDGYVFLGIIAATSVEDYEKQIIKRHEDTLEFKETTFKDYLKIVGFNAEPVLMTYPDNAAISNAIDEITRSRAEYEFTTTYRDTHYLWNVSNKEIVGKIRSEFEKMECLYIADGHHRSASSYFLQQELKAQNPNHTGKENYNFFMSYLIPESNLKIYEFNRMVKDLNGLTKEEFLIALDTHFRIENRGQTYFKPSQPHQFSMYLDGDFYSLSLRKTNYTFGNALDALDAQILCKTVLEPILGISDPRNDNRIEYAHGKKDLAYVKAKVDSKEFRVGFGLLPATVGQMKQIADQNLTMPPKTTYIEPKLRSGITIYEF